MGAMESDIHAAIIGQQRRLQRSARQDRVTRRDRLGQPAWKCSG